MKYYSEKLNRNFNTEKECLKAEKQYEREKTYIKNNKPLNEGQTAELVAKDKVNKSLVSKEKKEYADKITQAEKLLEQANKDYSIAQDKAAEILDKSNKEIKDLLDNAKAKVTEAERARRDALLEFNKKFGPYTAHYTGEKAIEEFNKAVTRFNEPIYDLFRYFWRLF